MRAGALPGDTCEAFAPIRLLAFIELQARRDVRRFVGFTRVRKTAHQLVEDSYCLGIISAAHAVARQHDSGGSSHARRALPPGDRQRRPRLGTAAVRSESASIGELRLRGVGALQQLRGRICLCNGSTRFSGAE